MQFWPKIAPGLGLNELDFICIMIEVVLLGPNLENYTASGVGLKGTFLEGKGITNLIFLDSNLFLSSLHQNEAIYICFS